jgi:hypothetical protein
MDGLTTGRMVHVNDAAGKCQAGVIAKVIDQDTGTVNIGGWRELGTAANWTNIELRTDEDTLFGWHWPERA